MRVTPRFVKLLILSSIAAHVLFLVAGHTFLRGWHWAHHPLHAVVEAAGTFVALSMAPLLLYLEGRGRGTSYNRPIANALIVMGVLDGVHSMVSVGEAFVWLHSIATLLGGLFFALIWVPDRWSQTRVGPAPVGVATLAIGVASLAFPDALPAMVEANTFTVGARLINAAGGMFFFIAAARLIATYRKHRKTDDLLFVIHCMLFGAAAIMFDASKLWDVAWWGWHMLRLMAYLVALWFLVQALKSEARALARKTLENEEKSRALERSNVDLQQFAYIASHDLQEPLRQVAGFVDLLAVRYQGQLDERAQTYIRHAVSGALRMQQLINDLLDFARVGQSDVCLMPTDCNAVVEQVLADLRITIEESGARIICAPLPMIMADGRQLGRVFQNLIANAIKFRGQEPPRVQVSARRDGDVWELSVADNGIGINQHEAVRLFQMFQRLHARGDYPGTGMGLAIAKKIVEHHGGRIWFESQPDAGTTFYFTIRALEKPGS